MALNGKVVLLTGASMGIGEAIAGALAEQGAKLALVSRSEDKLQSLLRRINDQHPSCEASVYAADVGDYEAVDKRVVEAGLALGAPSRFPELSISDITTMNNTNVNGYMFVTHSVLNRSMMSRGEGIILNITSTTALEAPPFPGETVYHANKALQEGFTNALRNELNETNIKVLALRPGVVATNFHSQRVSYDKSMYEGFMEGFHDVAEAAIFMLSQPPNRSIKALDVVPTAQRSLNVFDRKWNERNGKSDVEMD
ncbi:uncharacterized protein JN550_002470 [Neoarthrinium moseri]|uniref:uncharacterized protein n=1 Tax=Neoarthrinium moseri TaxID=1658444 RepID=UPI001FDE6809|nr:uncharacterized protein JN550_002470 [Neoarthrinium moseri]KAI1875041.1 hypothetical protein JN550_002470 [Neoarthrinium moseri]